MGYYLCFRKGGVNIYSTGVSSKLACAFVNAPWDEWKHMAITEFENARYKLIRDRESLEDTVDIYNQMFKTSTVWEERWDTITQIKEIKQEIREINTALIQVDMLQDIWKEEKFSEDEKTKLYGGLEWGVF